MRSFALWYSEKEKENTKRCNDCKQRRKKPDHEAKTPSEIDIHINLWEKRICCNDDNSVCFDFGFFVRNVSSVSKIFLYCPFEISKDNIEDLGSGIAKNGLLLNAIFNENYHMEAGLPRRLLIKDHTQPESVRKDSRTPFIIYQLDVENDFHIKYITNNSEENTKGSIISLDVSDVLNGNYGLEEKSESYYFRFRMLVKLDNLKLIFQKAKNVSPFQDAFTTTEVIDFRLNNLRSCCQFVRDEFAKGKHFKIKAIHYLILRDAADVFIHQGENVSSRLLEKDLWGSYIENLKNSIIAYHFKKRDEKNGPITEYGILTRFEYHNMKKNLILKYLYLVLYLGTLASVLATFFREMEFSITFGTVIMFIGGGLFLYFLRSIWNKKVV